MKLPQEMLDFPLIFNEEQLDILRSEMMIDPQISSSLNLANKKEKRAQRKQRKRSFGKMVSVG